jgi:uncharacterized membrane protein YfcA
VDWRTVGRFALGMVPGACVGIGALVALGPPERAEPWLKGLVGLYILGSLVLPTGNTQQARSKWWDFPLLGLLAGAAALTVGAVGPLTAPLFARRAFVKERLIATKAVCQSLLHAIKIPTFPALRSYEDLLGLGVLTLVMAGLVIPGTLLGKRLLRYLSKRRFILLYRVALLVAGLKVLLVDGVYQIMAGA